MKMLNFITNCYYLTYNRTVVTPHDDQKEWQKLVSKSIVPEWL